MFFIKYIVVVNRLVKLANDAARASGEKNPPFSFYLTNRSFLIPALGLLLPILIAFNFPLLTPLALWVQSQSPEAIMEYLAFLPVAAGILWAVGERLLGKTRVIWNIAQGKQAIKEQVGEDNLNKALRAAGAPVN